MREINFIEVGMKNFGPYVEPMVLTFENDKLTLITGPNGIGKTMSLEAIPYTLFGAASSGAKGDDVVNTRVGKNCHTWVKFSINSDIYLVDRYHKYKSLGNTVTISKNGEDPYLKGHKEVLPEVEKLICSKKSFTNTLMFGQKVKDFFTDLVDSDKKEIFRKILNLDIYTVWYKEADNDLKEIKAKLQKLLEQIGIEHGILGDTQIQIDILFKQFNQYKEDKNEKISNFKKSLEENERLLETWKADRAKLDVTDTDVENVRTQIGDVEKQIDHHEGEKTNKMLQLSNSAVSKGSEMREAAAAAIEKTSKKHRETYDILYESYNENLKTYIDEADEAKQGITDNRSELSSIETEKRIIQTNIDKLNDSLELTGGSCPTCLRVIDEECRNHLEKEVGDLIDKYQSFERREKVIQKSQETYQTLLNQNSETQKSLTKQFDDARVALDAEEEKDKQKIQEKLNAAIEKINELARTENLKIERDYEKYISDLNKKLEQLQGIKEVLENSANKIKEIDETIANLERNMKGIESQLKAVEEAEYDKSQLAAYQMRKQQLEKSIEEMNQGVVDLQKEENLSAFWKAAWSPTGIPSMLIDESIPFMNKKVSEYLDRLTNGRYIVSFDTLAATKAGEFRDKISVNVLDTHTRANSRIQLSGGQTRIVDIATILTLGDLQSSIQDVNINILLFDEIFDSLDEENIGFVSNILGQLKVGKSIYLISHTQVDQLEADEILELK